MTVSFKHLDEARHAAVMFLISVLSKAHEAKRVETNRQGRRGL